MSFTRRFLDSVNSLLERVAADEEPLSGISEEGLQAELEARVASNEANPRRAPGENPVARIAGAGEAARKKRAELADKRERRIRGERERRAARERQAQDDAFRRMKEEARRQGSASGGGASGARAGAGASGSSGRRAGGGFGGLGKNEEVAKAYKVLNLSYGAPFDEVKSAYRKLMRKYHPDLHNQSPKKQKAATELTMQVTQAYNTLEAHLQGGPNKQKS